MLCTTSSSFILYFKMHVSSICAEITARTQRHTLQSGLCNCAIEQLCIITCDVARENVGWRVMHATGSRILLNCYHEFCIFLLFYVCCTISYCNQNLSCFNVNDSPPTHTHNQQSYIPMCPLQCALCKIVCHNVR